MRYPLAMSVLLIALAAWAFNVRPFSFVALAMVVALVLIVLALGYEKSRADRRVIGFDRASGPDITAGVLYLDGKIVGTVERIDLTLATPRPLPGGTQPKVPTVSGPFGKIPRDTEPL